MAISLTTPQPLYISSGTGLVNMSVVPYMRAREVQFFAQDLRPNRQAYFFFDDTNVNRFVQNSSSIVLDVNSNPLTSNIGDGLYCSNTAGYATIVGYSPPPAANTSDSAAAVAIGGTIYLNENYISIGVTPANNAPFSTLKNNSFTIGDIIYQTTVPGTVPGATIPEQGMYVGFGPNAPITFTGKVEHWDSKNGILVVSPIKGTLTSNSTSTTNNLSYIYSANIFSSTQTTSIGILPGAGINKFSTGNTFINVNNNQKFNVVTYTHSSGICGAISSDGANNITLSGLISNNVVGQTLFITSGTGLGQSSNINGINADGSTVLLSDQLSPYVDGTSTYSIGALPTVDENGILCGIFQLPETQTVEFLSGTRVFTITDTAVVNDVNTTMIGQANYVGQGWLTPYVASSPFVTPSARVRGSISVAPTSPSQTSVSPNPTTLVDTSSTPLASTLIDYTSSLPPLNPQIQPIAQTFTTPPPKSTKQNYGIFASSVYVWFSSKPQGLSPQFPVTVQIVETVNGIPTSTIVASSTVNCQDVKLVTNNIPMPDPMAIGFNGTKFSFPDPVYLQPLTEYAVIVLSQSPDYAAYISEIGQTDITSGDNAARVSASPYVGSFFKNQNASTWTPIQNQNLMFILNKAQFDSTVDLNYVVDLIPTTTWMDTLTLSSSDFVPPSTNITYAVQSTIYDSSSNSFVIDPTSAIVNPSIKYYYSQDLSTASSSTSSRRRYILPGNSSSMTLDVRMQSFDPDVSPIFNQERLAAIAGTNIINKGGISYRDITILNDLGNHDNVANIKVTFSAPDIPYNQGGIKANGYVSILNINANTTPNANVITGITIDNMGAGYITTPTIVIDDVTPGAANSNTIFGGTMISTVAGENQKYGGNILTKYITKKVSLSSGFDAGDLRVFVNGVIPTGTNVEVYYKVLSASDTDTIADKSWQLMSPINFINSPDQNTVVKNQYAPSPLVGGKASGSLSYVENGTTYPLGGTFKYFAIKIALLAEDPSNVPVITSMGALALPAG